MPSRRTMMTRDRKRNSRRRKATHRATMREQQAQAANLRTIEANIRARAEAGAS